MEREVVVVASEEAVAAEAGELKEMIMVVLRDLTRVKNQVSIMRKRESSPEAIDHIEMINSKRILLRLVRKRLLIKTVNITTKVKNRRNNQ